MPDHPADRERGRERGRQWAPESAQELELEQLRDMYEQQGLGPADLPTRGSDRCYVIAQEIGTPDGGTPDAAKWPTLSSEWRGNGDPTLRAGFVEGALDVHEGRIET
jgi:hypothetical protein